MLIRAHLCGMSWHAPVSCTCRTSSTSTHSVPPPCQSSACIDLWSSFSLSMLPTAHVETLNVHLDAAPALPDVDSVKRSTNQTSGIIVGHANGPKSNAWAASFTHRGQELRLA